MEVHGLEGPVEQRNKLNANSTSLVDTSPGVEFHFGSLPCDLAKSFSFGVDMQPPSAVEEPTRPGQDAPISATSNSDNGNNNNNNRNNNNNSGNNNSNSNAHLEHANAKGRPRGHVFGAIGSERPRRDSERTRRESERSDCCVGLEMSSLCAMNQFRASIDAIDSPVDYSSNPFLSGAPMNDQASLAPLGDPLPPLGDALLPLRVDALLAPRADAISTVAEGAAGGSNQAGPATEWNTAASTEGQASVAWPPSQPGCMPGGPSVGADGLCSEHKKPVALYCVSCAQALCLTCLIRQHNGHRILEHADATSHLRQRWNRLAFTTGALLARSRCLCHKMATLADTKQAPGVMGCMGAMGAPGAMGSMGSLGVMRSMGSLEGNGPRVWATDGDSGPQQVECVLAAVDLLAERVASLRVSAVTAMLRHRERAVASTREQISLLGQVMHQLARVSSQFARLSRSLEAPDGDSLEGARGRSLEGASSHSAEGNSPNSADGAGTPSVEGAGARSSDGAGTRSTEGAGARSVEGAGARSFDGAGTCSTEGAAARLVEGSGAHSAEWGGTRSAEAAGVLHCAQMWASLQALEAQLGGCGARMKRVAELMRPTDELGKRFGHSFDALKQQLLDCSQAIESYMDGLGLTCKKNRPILFPGAPEHTINFDTGTESDEDNELPSLADTGHPPGGRRRNKRSMNLDEQNTQTPPIASEITSGTKSCSDNNGSGQGADGGAKGAVPGPTRERSPLEVHVEQLEHRMHSMFDEFRSVLQAQSAKSGSFAMSESGLNTGADLLGPAPWPTSGATGPEHGSGQGPQNGSGQGPDLGPGQGPERGLEHENAPDLVHQVMAHIEREMRLEECESPVKTASAHASHEQSTLFHMSALGRSFEPNYSHAHAQYPFNAASTTFGLSGRPRDLPFTARSNQFLLPGRPNECALSGHPECALTGCPCDFALNGPPEFALGCRANDYGLAGRTSDYGLGGRPNEYGQTGRPNEYGQTGRPNEYGQTGRPNEYGQTGRTEYGQTGRPNEYGQTGRAGGYARNGRANEQFAQSLSSSASLGMFEFTDGSLHGPLHQAAVDSLNSFAGHNGPNMPGVPPELAALGQLDPAQLEELSAQLMHAAPLLASGNALFPDALQALGAPLGVGERVGIPGNQSIGGNQVTLGGNQVPIGGNQSIVANQMPIGGNNPLVGGRMFDVGPASGLELDQLIQSSLNGPLIFPGPINPAMGTLAPSGEEDERMQDTPQWSYMATQMARQGLAATKALPMGNALPVGNPLGLPAHRYRTLTEQSEGGDSLRSEDDAQMRLQSRLYNVASLRAAMNIPLPGRGVVQPAVGGPVHPVHMTPPASEFLLANYEHLNMMNPVNASFPPRGHLHGLPYLPGCGPASAAPGGHGSGTSLAQGVSTMVGVGMGVGVGTSSATTIPSLFSIQTTQPASLAGKIPSLVNLPNMPADTSCPLRTGPSGPGGSGSGTNANVPVTAANALGALGGTTRYPRRKMWLRQEFGGFGSAEGELWEPNGIAVNNSFSEIYIADTKTNRMQVFNMQGTTTTPTTLFSYYSLHF